MIGGRYIGESHALAPYFTYSAIGLAWMIVFMALRLRCCRCGCCWRRADALSTFVKLGTILLLAVGIIAVRP